MRRFYRRGKVYQLILSIGDCKEKYSCRAQHDSWGPDMEMRGPHACKQVRKYWATCLLISLSWWSLLAFLPVVVCTSEQAQAEVAYVKGIPAYSEGKYREALVHLRKTAIEACRVPPLHFSLMVRAYCPNPVELYAFS